MKSPVIPIEAIQPDLSEFGQFLYKLMISKDIRTFNALANAMDTEEYRVFRQTIKKMATGEQPVQAKFTRRLAKVLDLPESEERELAWMLHRYG